MTFTNYLKSILELDDRTFVQSKYPPTPYRTYLTSGDYSIEVTTDRIFVSSPLNDESISIDMYNRKVLFYTFDDEFPCERHCWFWDLSEEQYFQNSLLDSTYTMTYEDNSLLISVLMKIMNHVAGELP